MDNTAYNNSIHRIGRIWTGLGLIILLSVPAAICVYFGVLPSGTAILKGLLSVGIIYLPAGIIEAVTYSPILGPGATYLAFISGNLINLRVPCTMNALEIGKAQSGTPEGDILSTLSVAASSLVSNLILGIGVIALIPLTPIITSAILRPGFSTVLSALFGALGYMYISKNVKLAIAPALFVAGFYLLAPFQAAKTASDLFVPVAAAVTILFARILFKKTRWLDQKGKEV